MRGIYRTIDRSIKQCNWHLLRAMMACLILAQCSPPQHTDLIISNARVYTVNAQAPWAAAIAVHQGRIVAVGSADAIDQFATDQTTVIDAKDRFVMPGFIEGHGHFSGLGEMLSEVNVLGTDSWKEVVDAVRAAAQEAEPGQWITGRGWHQEKWTDTLPRDVLGYPFHDALTDVSPANPVFLKHASGHGLIANQMAMEATGVSRETQNPAGGNIVRDGHGEPIGVFEENAMSIITSAYQAYLATLSAQDLLQKWHEGVELATAECLQNGVTSFHDAGSGLKEINRYRELAESGKLDVRLWTMIRHEYSFLQDKLTPFPIVHAGDHMFTCRAVKMSIDGALGSYGAWLLEPYDDNPGYVGQNTTRIDDLQKMAQLCLDNGLQLCVHAIGDRANREVLDVFEAHIRSREHGDSLRWRIEHAQHLHPDDIARFGASGIIASMQGIHCTSDAPFVVKRLGERRARAGAYAWRGLFDSGAVVTNGTDVPVEDIDPIASFYASVTRRAEPSGPSFFPGQSMTRAEALHSYTLANAYAAFEEDIKGSLEAGKLADIVILSHNLMECAEDDIPEARVLMTILGGEVRYQSADW